MESVEEPEALPPPPSVIPPDLVPVQFIPDQPEEAKNVSKHNRVPMSRRGRGGSRGQKIQLLCNHFKVGVTCDSSFFYQYSVALFYEDGRPVNAKGVGRKILDKVHETYNGSDLSGKDFAYDGENSLFTVGSLPWNKKEFTVILDNVTSNRKTMGSPSENDTKRMKRAFHSKTFKVEITFATKIPMQASIKASALKGQEESENSQEVIRVLDIILRQHAAKQGCLLVRQSFFHNDASNFVNLEGGVRGCSGFHSSFRVTQGGLSLNIDGSTTTIVQPGPLVDFLIKNQLVDSPYKLDWSKAKRAMKNLRIKASPSNQEFRINGVTESICKEQLFSMKSRGNGGEDEMIEVTVYDYFVNHRQIELRYSGDFPCINVGNRKRPTYIPLELCTLLPLQRYTKALSVLQRSKLVESSRQNPPEKMRILTDEMKRNNYGTEPLLKSCGISINNQFTKIEGRVLPAPKLKAGNGVDLMPTNGRWSFKYKKFAEPVEIKNWAVVITFYSYVIPQMISRPEHMFEESPQFRLAPPHIREKQYFIWSLEESDSFRIWNYQSVPSKISEQYLTNVLLKINAKLGGLNSLLAKEQSGSIPLVSNVPTIIFGMDVSHGSPGRSDVPSVAAVVSSRKWPQLSQNRASVRTQSPKVEMIDNLFKETGGQDVGIVRESLLDFCRSFGQLPAHIIIFTFNQVLNIELDQIIKACELFKKSWSPKFTVIVAQKNHHTKFFQAGSPHNVPPGTVIDNGVCHPWINDFYMCAHYGAIGTSRPTHYHVLLDEIGFSPDDLQELVHSLSYVYQKSLSAPSVVAPIRYAHLAARQISQFMKFDDMFETTSGHSHEDITAAGQVPVPKLPVLKENVASSMVFC
ncbi:Argonaute family protein [Euphorbia peplus]|nr:Argonaute family protein [Euphorbia peplus]